LRLRLGVKKLTSIALQVAIVRNCQMRLQDSHMDDTVLKPAAGFEYYKQEIYWNNFDQVQMRMNLAVSGDPAVGWVQHVRRLYGVRDPGFFISCGNGWVERDCFRAGLIRSAIGFDVLPDLVGTAAAEAEKIGMPARYFQADGNTLPDDGPTCELIVNHGAMHHIAYIDRLTRQMARFLKPGGIYVVNDYTGPHRNQYGWEAVSRCAELNHSLPEAYRARLGYAHVPTMLAHDPTEAIHSELQMDVLRRYFDIVTHVRFGGALAYSLLFQNHLLYRDQRTERGAACIGRILAADQEFLNERPESNLFTFAICTPKAAPPRQKQLDSWTREEMEREARARDNGGRYYPPTALELIYNGLAALPDATPAAPAREVPVQHEVAGPAAAHSVVAPPPGLPATTGAAVLRCKICNGEAPFFDVVDMNKCAREADFYPFGPSGGIARYHRCGACGLLFTPRSDGWAAEDISRFNHADDIAAADTHAPAAALRQHLAGLEAHRILDYGTGRFLASTGFAAAESYDPFGEAPRPDGRFDIIACFGVIERTPDPLATFDDLRSLLADGGCIVFSHVKQPPDIGRIRANWWNCAPRNGRISAYTDRALALIAQRTGMIYHRDDSLLHVMRKPGEGVGAEVARRCAPEFWTATLLAPRESRASAWHGPETYEHGTFRWSADKVLSWRLATPPGAARIVQVRIPYALEVRDGIAGDCRISIGGVAAALDCKESSIFGEALDVPPGDIEVRLELPELLRPADIGLNEDTRRLGLAIPVGSPPAVGRAARII
jgi:2-polyprenyl-6-hydroxyphenyl methylase/3-demethylubiquinone-9 3-methyltransferase